MAKMKDKALIKLDSDMDLTAATFQDVLQQLVAYDYAGCMDNSEFFGQKFPFFYGGMYYIMDSNLQQLHI